MKYLKKITALVLILTVLISGTISVTATDFGSANLQHNPKFQGANIRQGIDVSSWQETIDWQTVANSGVEYVFIRMAYRASASGTIATDTKAIANLQGALNAGLNVGAYIFSQAITEQEAIEEADYICNLLTGYNISLPVVMDYEYKGSGGRLHDANLTKEQGTANVMAFCRQVANHGYIPMLYANKSFLSSQVDGAFIDDYYHVWLANYTNETTYDGNYTFWQYTSSGSVDGIAGRVDCNVWYDFGSLDKNNIVGFNPTAEPTDVQPIYRMYQRYSGEHLYTSDANEVQELYTNYGWGYEGIGWYAPVGTGVPVYRLYNEGLKNHLYTTDLNEISVLTTEAGWVLDNGGNPLFYSAGDVSIYRLYNESLSGMHHLTTDVVEYNTIPNYGWIQEGVAFNAIELGKPIYTQFK